MDLDRILEKVFSVVLIVVITIIILYMLLPVIGIEPRSVIATTIPQVIVASIR